MAEDTSATIIHLHQPKRPKTDAERAKAYRERKKARAAFLPAPVTEYEPMVQTLVRANDLNSRIDIAVTSPSRSPAASHLLAVAALGLGVVGITMNGWFARSLGATETAGYLFLAVGVAADIVALAVPSVASRAWQARQRATAAAGWMVWAMTFAFAVMSGIGFASVNIADVTLSRSSRVTPAVTVAQTALADAMSSRDKECKGGVGKFCREREATVTERRQAVDAAMASVAQTADPQTAAAVHIVAWMSRGTLQPTADDFGMLRLMLLALLPQIGGVLLMIGRK